MSGHIVPPSCLLDLTVATTAANLNPGADQAGATPPPGQCQCAGSAEPGGGHLICTLAGFPKFCHTVTVLGNDLKNIIIYIYTVCHKTGKRLGGCYC